MHGNLSRFLDFRGDGNGLQLKNVGKTLGQLFQVLALSLKKSLKTSYRLFFLHTLGVVGAL